VYVYVVVCILLCIHCCLFTAVCLLLSVYCCLFTVVSFPKVQVYNMKKVLYTNIIPLQQHLLLEVLIGVRFAPDTTLRYQKSAVQQHLYR
jgi:hypothetical protein